jgi:Ca-activated chloride channel family protein
MKMGRYKSARDYYVKALQLGAGEDALANLKLALFMEERKQKRVEARANRKVEAGSTSGQSDQTKEGAKKASKSQSKMGQGSGTQSAAKSSRVSPNKRRAQAQERYELGSKAYELINKGYVHEKRPW